MAPLGRDATVAAKLLADARISSTICASFDELLRTLNEDASFVVIAAEALIGVDLRPFMIWIERQPAWSDLPFVVLVHHHGGASVNADSHRLAELLGNATLIERPFHPPTFISVARTAYIGRIRQYEARARIKELKDSEESLERRVAERTAELDQALKAVVAEMAQREQTEEKLRQSQKLEMIGQLTGGVAHDFNNLLMAVIGNLDLLRKRAAGDATALKLIDGAIQGAKRGAALTQRLLAFARRQDLKIEPTDLAELVTGMKDLIRRSIGGQIEFHLQIEEPLPPVLADANQVELAVLNLVINARDAMPSGGRVTLVVDQMLSEPGSGLPVGSYVRLTVADTGTGMDSETLSKATEPFFSTKELGKGTGLGLSMIHGLARQLGGALRLSSEVGIGTTAELWLPVTNAPVVDNGRDDQPTSSVATSKFRVLVVDDDVLISMSTTMMLEDLGHDVIEVNSGADALEVLKSRERIDLVITDFSMPKMNGAQLAKAARDLRPSLPILLATGYAELPSGTELTLPRIGKPYQQDQLSAAIQDMLSASPHPHDHVSGE